MEVVKIEIPENTTVPFSFPSGTNYFYAANRKYSVVKIKLDADPDLVTLNRAETRIWRTRATTAEFSTLRDSGLVEVITDQHIETPTFTSFPINYTSITPLHIRHFVVGEAVKRAIFRIYTPFDVDISVGWVSDNFFVLLPHERTVSGNMYIYDRYYVLDVPRDLYVYFWGTPTTGNALIYIER